MRRGELGALEQQQEVQAQLEGHDVRADEVEHLSSEAAGQVVLPSEGPA